MHLKVWDGTQLVNITIPEISANCRSGIYACFVQGDGHICVFHLWKYIGPDPLPSNYILLQKLQHEVPH